jgi:hypothetical protein
MVTKLNCRWFYQKLKNQGIILNFKGLIQEMDKVSEMRNELQTIKANYLTLENENKLLKASIYNLDPSLDVEIIDFVTAPATVGPVETNKPSSPGKLHEKSQADQISSSSENTPSLNLAL